MLSIISPELQMQHKNIDAHTMNMHIKELFDKTNRIERYETSNRFIDIFKLILSSHCSKFDG